MYPWKCRDLGGSFNAVDLGSVGCHAVAATAGCATVRAANKACNLQLTVCIVGLGVVFAYMVEQVSIPAFTGRAPVLCHRSGLGPVLEAAGGYGRVPEGC